MENAHRSPPFRAVESFRLNPFDGRAFLLSNRSLRNGNRQALIRLFLLTDLSDRPVAHKGRLPAPCYRVDPTHRLSICSIL
ncbi:MAG: hypothetical protein HSCHL_2690 [Hydrogenibacillus schlegelii]|uniref:Uncharacterized protein n=1 Tax=Hydrogenibacillus schlegelii TaxID=1484 RepID=A0A2T5G9E9_HYDSH|nr:MAG: hypothetical protein HSCHL_2690 [Hydrogenibacillus schlegelii]